MREGWEGTYLILPEKVLIGGVIFDQGLQEDQAVLNNNPTFSVALEFHNTEELVKHILKHNNFLQLLACSGHGNQEKNGFVPESLPLVV